MTILNAVVCPTSTQSILPSGATPNTKSIVTKEEHPHSKSTLFHKMHTDVTTYWLKDLRPLALTIRGVKRVQSTRVYGCMREDFPSR